MTTSTDKVQKPKKAKGPIRWEAVIPATVLTVLVGVYFSLFFDGHLRRVLEYVGTQVQGAEVNIGRLSTSFLGASLAIDDVQVTDKEKPQRNLVEVGEIRFKMLWGGLLRAKVVVEEASILNIQALTPRKSPGYVVPPPPPGKGESVVEKVQDQVLSQTRKKFNENFLGDVAAVVGGADPKEQLKSLQGELKSDARIKELEQELKTKKEKWDQRVKELPQSAELKQYETRVKALKFDVKNPAELAKNLKEADKIIKEVDSKVKLVEQTSKDVNGEVNAYTQSFKDLEKMVQEDIKDLQKRLKLPNLDAKEFSQQLFMNMVEGKLVSLQKYIAVARKYMPPKKTAAEKRAEAEEAIVPPKRGDGKNFTFPITTGYPLFWLKHAAISSELGTSELSGNMKGEILDLTTDQSFIRKPTLIRLAGDFPKQQISGVDAEITLDHRGDLAKDALRMVVGRFPSGQQVLSSSPEASLAIADSAGSSTMIASLIGNEITLDLKSQFTDIKYDLEAKNKIVKEILDGILKGIPVVNLNANVRGSFEDFDLHINSNLGEELAKGFQAQLQAKVAEAQAQLKKMIDQRIGGERDKLKQDMDKTVGDLTKNLGAKKDEVDKVVKEAKNSVEGGKKQGGGKKLEDEGKKLLKKLKIGG
jgi:uncharacterized protein (TIGR03545 family)